MGKQPRAFTSAAQTLGANDEGYSTKSLITRLLPHRLNLRTLAKALIKRVDPEEVKKKNELCPGGDIRVKGNQWVRAAWRDCGLDRVCREGQVREAIKKLIAKRKLSFNLSHY